MSVHRYEVTVSAMGRGTVRRDGVDISDQVSDLTIRCTPGMPTTVTIVTLAEVTAEVEVEG